MTKPRILFAGCSHTASSGFLPENQPRYHWPHLLTQHYICDYKNIAIGGMSNEEIFLRTVEELASNSYDLVVVMWSEIAREWVYFNDGNVDDFTIINYGDPMGLFESNTSLKMYAKLHYTYFNNLYVKMKKWLLLTMALESVLQSKGIPYVFVKGFGNYVTDFQQATYVNELGFTDMSTELQAMLDFENRPDFYISTKLNAVKKLMNSLDHSHWLEFDSYSFMDNAVDFADDGDHPGPVTNSDLSIKLIEHIDSNCLTFAQQDL
jgi:hypothetical protein